MAQPKLDERPSEEAEATARKLRQAAEREATRGTGNQAERAKADVETAETHPVLTSRDLAKGHAEPEPEEPSR